MTPIFFAIDENYVQPLAVALQSLFSNNKYKLEVHVIHQGLCEKDITLLDDIACKHNQVIKKHGLKPEDFFGYKENYHFTRAIYFRLLIPDILDESYKSAIYFDSDVVFMGKINYLLDLNLLSYPLAAVGNPNSESAMRRLGLDRDSVYFDTGLLVFNIPLWKKERYHSQALQCIEQNPQKLEFPDNDALNIILCGNYMELSPIYSLQSHYINNQTMDFTYFKKFGEVEQMFLNPLVVQYAGSCKPWHYMSEDHFKKIYWKNLTQTPFKDFKFKDKTLKNILKKNILKPLKNQLRRVI